MSSLNVYSLINVSGFATHFPISSFGRTIKQATPSMVNPVEIIRFGKRILNLPKTPSKKVNCFEVT